MAVSIIFLSLVSDPEEDLRKWTKSSGLCKRSELLLKEARIRCNFIEAMPVTILAVLELGTITLYLAGPMVQQDRQICLWS